MTLRKDRSEVRLKTHWAAVLLLLFSCFAVQFSQAVPQDSQRLTNYGRIVQRAPIFEYGTESGVLQTPWDSLNPSGQITVSGSYARTGTKSIKLYQPSSPKTDDQRRTVMRYYNNKSEFYTSWWVYFPDNFGSAGGSGQWTTLGGNQKYFGPSSDKWNYWTEWRFAVNDGNPRRIYMRYKQPFGTIYYYNSDFYLNSTYLNTWIHFQIFCKWGNNSDGIYTSWINNNLVKNLTGITNDPRGYSQWNGENCVWARPYSSPYIGISCYQPTNSPERWYYVDDVVASDDKVTEDYGVGYP